MAKTKTVVAPPRRQLTPAEFRRQCQDYEDECLMGHAAYKASEALRISAEFAREEGWFDHDLLGAHAKIVAAYIAREL
jgi:hypothetical protein